MKAVIRVFFLLHRFFSEVELTNVTVVNPLD